MANPVISVRVHEVDESGVSRVELVYESGSTADGAAANLDDVYRLASDHGIAQKNVVFHGQSFLQLRDP